MYYGWIEFRARRGDRGAARQCSAVSPGSGSRRWPTRSTGRTAFQCRSGARWVELGLLGITGRRGAMAALASAISPIASRWRRSAALRRPWASATARIPISASTRSTATARPNRRQRYLPKLISGEHVGALAMSEPGSGSDVVSMKLAGREEGRPLRPQRPQDVDHQRAGRRRAGGLRQDRPEAGSRGITAFLVEKGFKGFSTGAEARQARHARLQHLRACLRGL